MKRALKITAAVVLAMSMFTACADEEEAEAEKATEGEPGLFEEDGPIDEAVEEAREETKEKKFDWEIDDKLGDGKIGHDKIGDGEIDDELGDGDIGKDETCGSDNP